MSVSFANIPESIRPYVIGMEGTDVLERVLEAAGLPEQALIPLSDSVLAMIAGEFPLDELDEDIADLLNIELHVAARVASLVGKEFLGPIAKELGYTTLEQNIAKWEGKARVGALAAQTGPVVSPEAFVLSSLSTLAPTITDEILKHRLELALISYIRGERDTAGTLALFQRAEKVGGLALLEGEARALLAATDAALAHVRVTDEVEPQTNEQDSSVEPQNDTEKKETPTPSPETRPLTPPVPSNPVFLDIIPPDHQIIAAEERVEIPVLTPEPLLIEEQTLHPLKEEIVPSPSPAKPDPATGGGLYARSGNKGGEAPVLLIEEQTLHSLKKEEIPSPTPKPQPLIPSLVTADHFSEADAAEIATFETRAQEVAKIVPENAGETLLEETVAKLSSGLAEEFVKRLRGIVDARFRNVRDAYATRAMLEAPMENGGIGLRGRDLANALEIIEMAAATEDARLFALHKQTLVDDIAKRHANARKEEEKEVRDSRGEGKEEEIVSKITSRDVHAEPLQPHPDVLPIKQAVLSAASVSHTQGVRPRLDDIRSAPRLVGPLEELETMSIVDFRRLSPDPVTAMAKIRDKVALLEDQGFEKKIAAVKAWRTSPISRLYLEISREALQTSMAIPLLLARRAEEGKEAMTEKEWHAVMTLNAELRF